MFLFPSVIFLKHFFIIQMRERGVCNWCNAIFKMECTLCHRQQSVTEVVAAHHGHEEVNLCIACVHKLVSIFSKNH